MKMLLISYAVCFLLFFSVAFICGRMCSKNMSEYYAWKLFPLLMDKDKDYIATVGGGEANTGRIEFVLRRWSFLSEAEYKVKVYISLDHEIKKEEEEKIQALVASKCSRLFGSKIVEIQIYF